MRKAGVLMPVSALPSPYWCRRTWRICIPIYRVIKGESCKDMADTATESGWLW